MERIIEFLLSNIYWVIVIGGFLLSMLSRKKPNGEQKPSRTPKMPSFGGGPNDREPGSWLPGRTTSREPAEARAEAPRAPSAERTSVTPPREERAPLSSGVPERGSLVAAADAQLAAEAARSLERESSAAAAALTADADAVRRGVVWAEVLGPPRARKPYSYRK